MLRMKSRKRTKKMRGGGIFGPEFGGHVSKANEQAAYGWGKFLSGVKVGREQTKIARYNASRGYNENIKRTDSLGGNPPLSTPPLPTTPPPSITTIRKHRPVLYSPRQDPHTLVKKYNKPTGTIIDKYNGGRKTKKRRKRKKKKTKRKKRRRKRKTKRRKSRKKSRKKRGGIDDLCNRYYLNKKELEKARRLGLPTQELEQRENDVTMLDAHNYCKAHGKNMIACRIEDINDQPGGVCIKSSGEMKQEQIEKMKDEAIKYLKDRDSRPMSYEESSTILSEAE